MKHEPLIDSPQVDEPEHPTKTTRWINKAIIGALVVIAIGIGIFLRWSIQSEEVLKINNAPFPVRIVTDSSHESGGIVFLTVDYCKNQNVEGNLRMSYVSTSREVFLPVTKERIPKGCQKSEVPVIIPKELPPDTYRIKFRSSYDINPLKKNVFLEFYSKEFPVGNIPATNKKS